MKLLWAACLCSLVLALSVPFVALALVVDPERHALGLPAAPFGWMSLLVVHVLATLPLSAVLAAILHKRLAMGRCPWRACLWATAGVGLALVTVDAGAELAAALDKSYPDLIPRLIVRVLWCLALELPWCLCCLAIGQTPARLVGANPTLLVTLLVLVISFGLPAVYTMRLIAAQTKTAEELFERMHFQRAFVVVHGLCDVGSDGLVAKKPPRIIRQQLRADLRVWTLEANRPLPTGASVEERKQRSMLLAGLDRFAEAERELRRLADSDVEAALLLAFVHQYQKRWAESSTRFRRALTLLEQRPSTDSTTTDFRVRAYDALAMNARELQAYAEAQAIHEEAIRAVPAQRAYFHFQLGRHYQVAGRPVQAIEHLETAVELDRARFAKQAAPLLKQLRQHTPGCLLR